VASSYTLHLVAAVDSPHGNNVITPRKTRPTMADYFLPIRPPPVYTVTDDFDRWCGRFEFFADGAELRGEKKVRCLITNLDSAAYREFELLGLTQVQLSDYETVKAALSQRFKKNHSSMELRIRFKQRRQQENESVSDFASAVIELCNRAHADMSVDARLRAARDQFMEGLRDPTIQDRVTFDNPATLDEARRIARQMEANLKCQEVLRTSNGALGIQAIGHPQEMPPNHTDSRLAAMEESFARVEQYIAELANRKPPSTRQRETTPPHRDTGWKRPEWRELRGTQEDQQRRGSPSPCRSPSGGRGVYDQSPRRVAFAATSMDGRPICHRCGKAGHVWIGCREYASPSSSRANHYDSSRHKEDNRSCSQKKGHGREGRWGNDQGSA
jgi:hypothetical protein